LARALHLRSAITVPLIVRGRVNGVLTWASTDEGRRYDEDDLRFAEHLARRAATAIDNSELHSQTLRAAEELQRAVLPEVVAGGDGWEIACDYHPSGRAEVGGDFYDAFPLDDDRYVLFMGDVMGRGVAAAAAMAQMRSAVRAFTSVDPAPAVVVAKVDQMLVRFGSDQLVTLVYVLADQSSGSLLVVNAGHPPPMLLRAGGRSEYLPYADGPPLGVTPARRRELRVPFSVGDTLLTYTDGLVERRDEDIQAGLARLEDALPHFSGTSLADGLGRVVTSVRDTTYDDDTAVLAFRRTR
jgi:serine phosphatase RsbU (regulator of sigma subunit)